MASRVILMSPSHKSILASRNFNQAEKENQGTQHSSIIVRAPREPSSDSDSDGWSTEKKKRSSTSGPHYVTRDDGLQQRRRHRLTDAPSPSPATLPSHVIARRNERERNRVRQVNESFAVLRSHIPDYLYDAEAMEGPKAARKKLSKVETLRLAVHYIQKLEHLLDIQTELGHSDEEGMQFIDSETQVSSVKTDADSELDSDIIDLSSDPRRRSPQSDTDPFLKLKTELLQKYQEGLACKSEEDSVDSRHLPVSDPYSFSKIKSEAILKFADEFQCKSDDGELDEGSMSPYSPRCATPPTPTHPPTIHLPSIATFPTKGLPLNYADLYSQH